MINLDTEFPSGGKGYCGDGGIEVIRAYVRDLRHRATEYGADMGVQIPESRVCGKFALEPSENPVLREVASLLNLP